MSERQQKKAGDDRVHEVLSEAENFHLRDCPAADPFQRAGSMLLDFILAFLLGSGVDHAGNAFYTHLINLPLTLSFSKSLPDTKLVSFLVENAGTITRVAAIGSKISFLIFAFGWLVNRFGGSPAQLLVGLKVVDEKSGKTLEINQALFRQLSLVVTFPLSPLAFFRKDRRTAHDLLTESSVRKVHGVR